MGFRSFISGFFKMFEIVKDWADEETKIYSDITEEKESTIHSMWDFLSFTENTQAFHLVNVIGFEEWVNMEEIRRRVKEIFSVEYKNEKSLYPYLKTLTDVNLFESSNIGGRRKWRKKDLLFELETEKESELDKEKPKLSIRAKSKSKK